MTGDLMSVFRDAPNPPPAPVPTPGPGIVLGDTRSSPATRTAAEAIVTWGRGEAPAAATFAEGNKQSRV